MKTVLRWLPAILICVFIFWLSAQTGPELKEAGLGSDEVHIVGHFWMFFFLSVALYRGTKKPWLAVLISFLYALSDEFHQRFTPGRSSALNDIVNDTLAATVAGLLIWKFYQKLPKILKNWLEA
jgi:VanZ family protein